MISLLDILFATILLAISTSFALLVTMPFLGTLVRYRANYTPKGLQLDQDGTVQPHVGPVVHGYWSMFMRTRRIEGARGLYKGTVPCAISGIVLTVIAGVLLGATLANPRGPGRYNVPDADSWLMLIYTSLLIVVSIPFNVITYRAITTPHKLPWFNLQVGCSVLLTPSERKQPWRLYLIPGLMASQLLHVLYNVAILHSFRRLILPSLSNFDPKPNDPTPKDFTWWRFGIYFLIVLLSVSVLAPLEVISTRLSLQRSHGGADFTQLPQDENATGVEEAIEFAGEGEDVVGLRSEDDPYIGLSDCAKRIIDEEGVGVLYRASWVTFLFAALGSLG